MSNAQAVTMALIARDVIGTARQSAHRVVDGAYVASGVAELAHRTAILGVHRTVGTLGSDGSRLHEALHGALAEAKSIVLDLIADAETTARQATDGLARTLEGRFVDRIAALFDGRATRSIERMALPAAEMVRSVSVGVNAAVEGLYDFRKAETAEAAPVVRPSRKAAKKARVHAA